MSVISLEPETEQRLAAHARQRGISDADLIHALIEEGLDDLDDTQMAVERLSDPRKPLTNAEAHKAPGLDD